MDEGFLSKAILKTQKAESLYEHLEDEVNDVLLLFSSKSKTFFDNLDFIGELYTVKSTKETIKTT